MKKILFAFVIISGCFAPACHHVTSKTIEACDHLPSGECLYTVACDSADYTFIDECGKYAPGQKIQ